MFERFTKAARFSVTRAQGEARRLRHRHIGSEHLLLALLTEPEPAPVRATLEAYGLTHAVAEAQLVRILGSQELDSDALKSVGVDLDDIRRRAESEFGPGALEPDPPTTLKGRRLRRQERLTGGHIPFTDDAKLTLELALREATALGHNYIGSEHLLLGLIRGTTGFGLRVIQAQGIESSTLRSDVIERLQKSA